LKKLYIRGLSWVSGALIGNELTKNDLSRILSWRNRCIQFPARGRLMKPRLFIICSALSLVAGVSHAGSEFAEGKRERLTQLPIEELMKIQVTTLATGTQQRLDHVPAVASVITARDIEAMGAITVEEALESIPGLHVSNSGQAYTSKYLIRGISTVFNPQTLVMVNGIPISSIVRGDRLIRLGVLPVKMVERIEIIRGPGSALYGADAFAGVINVITKTAAEIRGSEGGGRAGSFEFREIWFLHGKKYGDLNVAIMADYQETEGHKETITEDAQTLLDQAFGTRASLAPGPVSLSEKGVAVFLDAEKSKWHLRGSYFGKNNVGMGQGIAEALDPRGRAGLSRVTGDLTYRHPKIGENWDFSSQVSYHHGIQGVDEYEFLFPPGANLGSGAFPDGVIGSPEFRERQFRFHSSLFHDASETHRLHFGAGLSSARVFRIRESNNFTNTFAPRPNIVNLSGTPEIYLPENSRFNVHGYAQDEWKLSDYWELTTGARYDHYSDFGHTFNPRVALVWRTTPDLTTKLLYGRAFRAPSFAELYTINNPVALGNPNLTPEMINTYELAWIYQITPEVYTGLNLFHYDITDLITFVRDPVGTTTAQNSSNQKGNGFEFETKIKALGELLFTGNYAYIKAKDEKSGKDPGDYPNHKAYLRSDWAYAMNWDWSTQIHWIGTRKRQPADTRSDFSGYTIVDLILRHKLVETLNIRASVRNLFDADAREPSSGPAPSALTASIPNDLPQAGRNFYAELAYTF